MRANASRPAAFLGLRYNDRDGLIAMGIPVDGPDTPAPRAGPAPHAPIRFPAATAATPRPLRDGARLAACGRARMPSRWTATGRTADGGLPRRRRAGVRATRRPPREAGLEFPPPLHARRRSGGGSAAGSVLARGEERRSEWPKRNAKLSTWLYTIARNLCIDQRAARGPSGRRRSLDGPTKASAERRRRCTIGSPPRSRGRRGGRGIGRRRRASTRDRRAAGRPARGFSDA